MLCQFRLQFRLQFSDRKFCRRFVIVAPHRSLVRVLGDKVEESQHGQPTGDDDDNGEGTYDAEGAEGTFGVSSG